MKVLYKLLITTAICAGLIYAHHEWIGVQLEQRRTTALERAESSRAENLRTLRATTNPVDQAVIRTAMRLEMIELTEQVAR